MRVMSDTFSLRVIYLIRGCLVMLGVTLLLPGCIDLPDPKMVQPRLYRLDAQLPIQPALQQRNKVLLISLPHAQPGTDSAGMAYMKKAHELDYFVNSRWADTPARMLEPLLLQAMLKTGSFRTVTKIFGTLDADIRLDSEWIRLQQEFDTQPSRMHLIVRVQLFDLRSKQVLATQEIEEVEPAESDNAYGGVVAANRALQRVLEKVAIFCVNESAVR